LIVCTSFDTHDKKPLEAIKVVSFFYNSSIKRYL
jgi:hypothetical protein